MIQAKLGDIVRVHYTGKLEDGSVFDSSEDCECGCDSGPLEFKIGEGQVIRGFENGVIGMAVGERKTVNIPVAEGYGERLEEMVAVIERMDIPQDLDPEVGQQMEVTLQDGQSIPVLVTDVTETTVTLDANHPLAGKDLIFDIELVEIG